MSPSPVAVPAPWVVRELVVVPRVAHLRAFIETGKVQLDSTSATAHQAPPVPEGVMLAPWRPLTVGYAEAFPRVARKMADAHEMHGLLQEVVEYFEENDDPRDWPAWATAARDLVDRHGRLRP